MQNIKTSYCYAIIAVIGLVVFYNSLDNEFVFDDESVVLGNESIREFSNIPKFFTAEEGFHKVIGRYYRPVVSTSYAVDYNFWELDPYGFHLMNVVIHLIATFILFRLLFALFSDYKYAILASLIGAVLFLVHPIHTEAVSWVSGRTDSLVTLFFFASFLYYVKYTKLKDERDRKKKPDSGLLQKYLIFSLLFYFIGLLSKEMIITMPVVIILFDWIYRMKPLGYLKKNIKVYGWFIGVSIFYLLIRYIVLKDIPERENYRYFLDADFVTVAATMLKTLPIYFKLLFYPAGLLYHYNGYIADASSFFEGAVLLSMLFTAAAIWGAWYAYKKRKGEISFCILFFFVSLLPVMNIIPTMNLMAERFLYMTSFALILLTGFLIAKYMNKDNSRAIIISVLAVVVIFSYMTIQRNADWKNNDTLYSTADGIDGTVLLVNAGNIYANKQQYGEAEKRYRRALGIRDNSVLAHHNLGLIHLIKGQLDSAEIQIKKGMVLDSLAPDGYYQLASIYKNQGRILQAIQLLEKLQEVAPDYKGSKAQLDGLKSGSLTEGPGLKNHPNLENDPQRDMLDQRAFQLYESGDYKSAIAVLEKLISLVPAKRSGYLNNIGLCYEGLNDNEKALEYYKQSIEADPMNINAYNGMSSVYLKLGDKEQAISNLEQILVLNPQDAATRNKLDSLRGK